MNNTNSSSDSSSSSSSSVFVEGDNMSSSPSPSISPSRTVVEDLEWEEWDGESPFWHHCIAGSIAGVGEHVLLYPVDTVKTHMQSYCDNCPHNNNNKGNSSNNKIGSNQIMSWRNGKNSSSSVSMWSTMRSLVQTGHGQMVGQRPATTWVAPVCEKNASSSAVSAGKSISNNLSNISSSQLGYGRLWRGVQTMAVGCVPAHALYFSLYEFFKPQNAALAGAAAALGHDAVMTPLDTVKQRMQLGHYQDMRHALQTIFQQEGLTGLYRSFPITLLTNLPYGIIMVSTNEHLRQLAMHHRNNNTGTLDLPSTIFAGCGAGAVASALTTPLDCVKTRLQTQRLSVANNINSSVLTNTNNICNQQPPICHQPKYNTVHDAFRSILKQDGFIGLFRGITPRVLTHTPAVAISWTTYEMAKSWLSSTTTYFSPVDS
mmetsp:Transcript_19221/g.18463  ORF Transcript_19221/g.18463 Transcript_19221/m.18463 type:complete len:430 (-) Transcript_19221:91-1380(-)